MSETRQLTMGPDDRRRQTGLRVIFNPETETAAWYLARLSKWLSPERCRQLRLLAECMLTEDTIAATEGQVDGSILKSAFERALPE